MNSLKDYISNIIDNFKNLNDLTKKIMKKGFIFCSILGIISLIILLAYNFYYTYPILFYLGFTLFRLSLTFASEFIICGFVVDKIKAGVI